MYTYDMILGEKNTILKGYVLMNLPHCQMTCVVQFSSVQSLSHVRLFVTPWTAARQANLEH